jgi:hypothetical protein
MKTTILKISAIALLFCLLVTGCKEDEELSWEISPKSKSAVIQKKVDGIEFKFCLLNEDGKPSTVFNQGENFSFHFSVINNNNEKFYFYPGYAYSEENDFCRVYSLSQVDEGKPYIFKGANLIGTGGYPFEIGDSYIFEQSWIIEKDFDWDWKYGSYESADKKPLESGDYYTEFYYNFLFERLGSKPPLSIGTLSFKINFTIKEK